nr:DUF2298 domain-containing protein [Kallotenue papyrolyticum]
MIAALLSWWLALLALGLLALPLTTWLLRQLPDRGYSFARPLGLLLTGYGAWLLSMLGLAAFERWLLLLAALGWGGLGLWLQGRAGLRALGRWARGHWRWIAFQEALLALGIAGGLWLRWHQFWGNGAAINITEQPMDLTLLTGILSSPQFPPHDPWLAGYAINYYYLGYLLIAVLTRLTALPASVGYTLGLATIFALSAGGVAGLVRNLVDATACAAAPDDQPPAAPAPGGSHAARALRWIAPLLGLVFVLIVGNQGAALQVLTGSVKAVALPPRQLWQAVVNGLGARQALDLGQAFPAQHFDGDPRLVPGAVTQDFAFGWWPSRMVWDTLTRADGSRETIYAITEFPFFSFLLGDLHPHVLALPWTLLAIATALNVALRESAPALSGRNGWLRLGLTAIVLGSLYAINSWDLPTYLLLYLGALTLLYARLAGGLRRVFWAHWLQNAGLTVLASYLAYLPFHLSFVAPTHGFPLGLAPARHRCARVRGDLRTLHRAAAGAGAARRHPATTLAGRRLADDRHGRLPALRRADRLAPDRPAATGRLADRAGAGALQPTGAGLRALARRAGRTGGVGCRSGLSARQLRQPSQHHLQVLLPGLAAVGLPGGLCRCPAAAPPALERGAMDHAHAAAAGRRAGLSPGSARR